MTQNAVAKLQNDPELKDLPCAHSNSSMLYNNVLLLTIMYYDNVL